MPIKYPLALFLLFTTKILCAAELINLSANDLSNELHSNALVIDIRTPEEWQQTGVIPGSHPIMFFDKNGKSDAEQWLTAVKQLQTSPDQEIILVCRSGGRSGKVGHYLTDQLNMSHVSHLASGISSWLKEKRPTQKMCSPTQTC
ncbi:MAG: rhodanese-like domain-containing protein [Methyloprofundus sp.]|nr:rhodanese-like domain-containing protein [Methyloprofundus sp.]MBW6452864.1 rhodanese-like domain-containing protein [Methyloprofundus sp.]